jgi:DNA-directed RNA polymerase specialized sigma24 family protein
MLVPMTANKSTDLIRRERSLKRGAGRVLDEAALDGNKESAGALDNLVGGEPTPEFVAQMAEQCECLLARLNDRERRTAEFKLQGFSNQEIADQMVCTVRTVERRLEAVRYIWKSRS